MTHFSTNLLGIVQLLTSFLQQVTSDQCFISYLSVKTHGKSESLLLGTGFINIKSAIAHFTACLDRYSVEVKDLSYNQVNLIVSCLFKFHR